MNNHIERNGVIAGFRPLVTPRPPLVTVDYKPYISNELTRFITYAGIIEK